MNRKWSILPCSAASAEGLQDVTRWMVEAITLRKSELISTDTPTIATPVTSIDTSTVEDVTASDANISIDTSTAIYPETTVSDTTKAATASSR